MSGSGQAVFLSYASQDAEAAKRICDALREAGVEVWFDQSELVGGDAWDQKIRKQIRECALLLPVISKTTQARREAYFRLEWKLADERTHLMAKGTPFLLPITIDETSDRDAIVPDSFLAVQWTKLPGGETPPAFGERVGRLLAGRPGSGDPGPRNAKPASRELGPPRSASRRRLVPVALGLLVAAGIAWWQPWKGRAALAGPAPAALTPAADLREKVKALIAKPNGVREDLDTAASLMEQAVRLEPTAVATWVQWVWLDLAYIDFAGDRSPSRMKAARDHLAQAAGLAPEAYEVRLARAALLMHQDNWNSAMVAEAEPQLRGLLRERPDDGQTLLMLSWCLHNLGRHEDQLQLLDRAARLPAFATTANLNRMAALFYMRRFEEAEQAYARIPPESRPHDATVILATILCFWRGDPESARRVLDALPPSALAEDYPGGMAFYVHFLSRDYDRALASARRIAHDYVESPMISGPKAYFAGLALAHAGRTQAAQAEWRSALQLVEQRLAASPNDESLLHLKITLLADLGERAAAEQLWRTVLELYPRASTAWRALVAIKVEPPDRALDFVDFELKNSNPFWTAALLRLEPEFDFLRALPRFQVMLAAAEADPRLSPKAGAAAKDFVTP